MATVNRNNKIRINQPVRAPVEVLRSLPRQNKQILMPFPGSNEVINIGQQIGATVADPLGFKAAIDGYKEEVTAGIPGFLVGAAVLIVGLMLLWAGVNAFILPAAGKIAATAVKAAT